jgi:hypothetical protein
MKKIYLCAIALSIGSISFGQRTINSATNAQLNACNETPSTSIKDLSLQNKAPGDIIWSEDFSGGFPAGWSVNDNTGNGFDWVINNAAIDNYNGGAGPGWTSTGPILSNSGGDHMLLFGDDYNNGTGTIEMNSYFQTSAIALTGQPNVSVRFQQKFRLCCSSGAALNLVVSTDPTFATFQTFDVRQGIAINDGTPDPMNTTVNISSIAGGYTGNIYLRFHWNLGATHYYWMVDDIEVFESLANDLVGSKGWYGFGPNFMPYTRIPADQITGADFMINAENVGGADQTNTILTADVNGGVFTGTSTPQTVIAGATDSLFSTTQFTPPVTTGIPYNVTLTISSDSVDTTPLNNVETFPPFEISASTYALDDYGSSPSAGGGLDNSVTPPSAEFEAGNFYDIVANAFATHISVYIGTGTPAGTPIDVVLYDWTSGSPVEVDRSAIYTTTAGDVGSVVTLALAANPAVTAGSSYFAAVHCYSEFYYGRSGNSPDGSMPSGQTSLIFYPNMSATTQNYYTTNTPMVRLTVVSVLSDNNIVSKNASFNVYPNPSNGEFNITLTEGNSNNVSLTVKNVVGQTIINKNIAVSGQTKATISLADYSKGIYFLTIDNETVKLVVE